MEDLEEPSLLVFGVQSVGTLNEGLRETDVVFGFRFGWEGTARIGRTV